MHGPQKKETSMMDGVATFFLIGMEWPPIFFDRDGVATFFFFFFFCDRDGVATLIDFSFGFYL